MVQPNQDLQQLLQAVQEESPWHLLLLWRTDSEARLRSDRPPADSKSA